MRCLLPNLTLQWKIGLIVLVGLLLAIVLFGYLGLSALGRSTQTRLQERLTMARLVADYEDQVLGLFLASLETAAGTVSPYGELAVAERELDSLRKTGTQLGLPVADVFVLNREGERVWGTLPWAETSVSNITAYPDLQRTLVRREPSVSRLTSIPSTDRPVVLLASAIYGTEAVLVVAVDLIGSSIAGFMKPVELGETGYVELVDETGLVVARTIPGRAPRFFEKSDHPERFASLIASGEPMVGTCHRCHVEAAQTELRKDVLAFAPLRRASWGVVVRQSEEEALAPTRELKQGLIVAGALMTAMTLGLVWLATSNMVARIRSLKTASLRMASGDLSSPIPIQGKDELGTLAETMDSTRLKLKASYEAVEQRTKELGALLAISQTLTSVPDLSAALDAVVAKVVEIIPSSDGGLLLLYEGEEDRFVVQSVVGITPDPELKDVAIPTHGDDQDTSQVRCMILPGLPPGLQRLTETVCTNVLRLAPVRSLARSAASAPMVSRDHLVSVLVLVNSKDDTPFTQADLDLLQTLANEMAMAVDNVRLSRHAEEARLLRETDRLKSEFLSTVSHELRTPLTSIKGYTTSLLREDVVWEQETRTEFLKTIDEKTDELRDLIDKLLQMARVEGGRLDLRREPVLLNRLAEEVVAEVSPTSPKHQFKIDFPTPFPVIEGDLHNLKIVLRNLVDNAVNYSPQGGSILLSGNVSDGEIIVKVADQGIGIAAKDLDRIFERFYRVNGDLTNRVSGSGLGLSVVKALVEAHGGKVWVESKEGQGSTFFFALPVEREYDGEEELHTSGG